MGNFYFENSVDEIFQLCDCGRNEMSFYHSGRSGFRHWQTGQPRRESKFGVTTKLGLQESKLNSFKTVCDFCYEKVKKTSSINF